MQTWKTPLCRMLNNNILAIPRLHLWRSIGLVYHDACVLCGQLRDFCCFYSIGKAIAALCTLTGLGPAIRIVHRSINIGVSKSCSI